MKLSSDDTFIASFIMPWLFMLIVVGMIVFSIVDGSLLFAIPLGLMLVAYLLSGRFTESLRLAEVRAFEDDRLFEISDRKGVIRIPFAELQDVKIRRNYSLIELRFTDRTVLFVPEKDHLQTFNIGQVIDFLEQKVLYRTIKR